VELPSDSTKVTVTASELSLVSGCRCSGRSPSVTSSPGFARAASTTTRSDSPLGNATVAPRASACTSFAGRKFIRGEPMKPATKRLSGCSYNSSGEPTCSILPALSTTMRSASVIASTWSWVT
jgi:hypothetical protein